VAKNEELLREIQENYKRACSYWKDAREERKTDLAYICGDPWTKAERDARDDAGRPVCNHDELNQYVNQSINQLRINKRGIKVEPSDEATSDKSAELLQGKIRAIEYDSNAQAAYLSAAQNMLEGSYGFFRIGRRWASQDPDDRSPAAFDQKIVIKNIPNPDSVLYDCDVMDPDWSDADWCFVLEPMPLEDFKREYPHAEKIDFTSEDRMKSPDWIQDKTVLVAEYWRVRTKRSKLYKLASGEIVDTLPKGETAEATRDVDKREVWCYQTNGVEILHEPEKPEPGDQIPIVACIGMERWVDEGGGAKRMLFSLVRLARDPQKTLAYIVSQQMEEAGLSPRSPYVGYVGQFETDREAWEGATKVAHAMLQADPIPDSSNGQILPLPIRNPFTPNFAAYEVAKDSCRRAIQAAMGISPLPTSAQRENQKSGIALQRIQSAEQTGSFHFVDGFERALMRAGRIIDSWIPTVYDREGRVEPIRTADDTQKLVTLNTQAPYLDQQGQQQHHMLADGSHNVTVSVGPSSDSQKERAQDFLEQMIPNLPNLPIPPQNQAKILALSIQMQQMGPRGDMIAELISPPATGPEIPPQMQAQMQQAQQTAQQLHAYAQSLEAEIVKLQQKEQAHVVDNEYKLQLERMKIEAQLATAEINTKAQVISERVQMINDMWAKLHDQTHEAALQSADFAHEASLKAMDHGQQEDMQQAAAQQAAQQPDQAQAQAQPAG
jgi:hypothetical protein